MSDTPRTDAMTKHHNDGVPSDFARELERENNQMRTALDKIYNHNEAARAAVIEYYGLWHKIPMASGIPLPEHRPKHSAIAEILWQVHDEHINAQKFWENTTDDSHGIKTGMIVKHTEDAHILKKVLERSYGPRAES